MPAHVVHRTFACAPPFAPPIAMIRVPSVATEYQRASGAYGDCGFSGTGVWLPAASMVSIVGDGVSGVSPALSPPTRTRSPIVVSVLGSTPAGRVTVAQDSRGPLPAVEVADPEPSVDVHAPSAAAATSVVTTARHPAAGRPIGSVSPPVLRSAVRFLLDVFW